MSNVFFASDHHFGHKSVVHKFKRRDGSPLRDFPSVEAMDEHIIDMHNHVVGPKDIVWFLGDVCFTKKSLSYIKRMNGTKHLILGNHDTFSNGKYQAAGFESLNSMKACKGFICTHLPVHPDSLQRWGVNVHGHLHDKNVQTVEHAEMGGPGMTPIVVADKRYINVAVEMIDYTPVSIDEIRETIEGDT